MKRSQPSRPAMRQSAPRVLAWAPWLLLCLGIALAACTEPAATFHSTDITGADFGRNWSLTDHHGSKRHLADFAGKAVALFFGYTQCPDVCPTTMATMGEVMRQLGPEASRLQVLFMTLDPERDTQALLAEYVPAFHPSFLGLRADTATTAAVAKDFRVFYQKQASPSPGHYTIDHSAGIYLYDPAGRLRLYVRHGEKPGNIAADIKQLLAGR